MNKSKILIRPALMSDLAEMQLLFVETINAICKKDYAPEQIKTWTSSVEDPTRWVKKLQTQYFLLAHTGPRIIGYASLQDKDYLDFLYIHKNFQRQGIANRLYTEIESEAIKRSATMLNANVSITARPFFEKKGFKTLLEQRKKINGVEITNYKMTKNLVSK